MVQRMGKISGSVRTAGVSEIFLFHSLSYLKVRCCMRNIHLAFALVQCVQIYLRTQNFDSIKNDPVMYIYIYIYIHVYIYPLSS